MNRAPTEAEMEPVRAVAPGAVLALLADGAEHSGSALATRLAVTRAAIWKQIEALRAHGLDIAAEAGRGYRLAAPFEPLDASKILDATDADRRDAVGAIDVRWQIDSTSSELARRLADAPAACIAEIQSAGRGRRGRAWRMPLGGGVALSSLRRFDVGMAALSGLSLVAGLAAIRAMQDIGVGGVALKWPNDLVVDGKKLGGVLVELGGDALGPCHAIVGIGLNVRIGKAGEAIDQPWTDLAALANERMPSRNVLAGRLLSRLAETLDKFVVDGFAAFERDYAQHDALRDSEIVVADASGSWAGIARGVGARGALRVERDDTMREIDSGEVSVRRRDAKTRCAS
jgi:BirA family biotin operon repressor/biotin-[acetyl-CoA-carboxylase] ligase